LFVSRPPHSKLVPTIGEVAKAAGVSRATVSRTFSQPRCLSEATLRRVLEVAERLGYVPNQVARALSTGRAGNIALIVPDVANPFFPPLIRGAQARSDEAGYAVFLGDSDETPAREDVLLAKLAAQVEGFVLAAPRLPDDRLRIHAKRRPLVLINRDVANIPRVLIDTAAGVVAAIDHLVALGHRHIIYVSGPSASWSNQQRQLAAAQATERAGIRFGQIGTHRPTYVAGQQCTEELLATGATAVVAFDDLVAQGIMAGVASRGMSVPERLSVVGCDDVLAATTYPPLTTVAAHCREAGERAVELLLEMLATGAPRATPITIATELVVRATTAPPPGAVSQRLRRRRGTDPS
jgi:LacI family transcriptional regulator